MWLRERLSPPTNGECRARRQRQRLSPLTPQSASSTLNEAREERRAAPRSPKLAASSVVFFFNLAVIGGAAALWLDGNRRNVLSLENKCR